MSVWGCESKHDKTKDLKNKNIALFISDFHIGENEGSITISPLDSCKYKYIYQKKDKYWIHKKVDTFLHKLDSLVKDEGKIENLILLGDIFDLAVHENAEVFNLSQDFFGKRLKKYFKRVVYIPGNHDHHMWEQLQYDQFIIKNHKKTGAYEVKPHVSCEYLNIDNNEIKLVGKYKALSTKNFVSKLMSNNKLPVYISYPNFYIISDDHNKDICVTHGHLLQPGWNKQDSLVKGFSKFNLDSNYFRNIEMKNAPFTELSNFSVADNYKGLADSLVDKQLPKTATILNRQFPAFFTLDTKKTKINNKQLLINDSNITKVYFKNVEEEMSTINSKFKILIYGHTHLPSYNDSLWGKGLYNTGGWVRMIDANNFTNTVTDPMPNPMILTSNGEIKKVLY